MSFGGHVYDMIVRDKNNRELRKSITKGRAGVSKKNILGTYRKYNKIPAEELDEITGKIKEKKTKDEFIIAKEMLMIVFVGLGIVLIFYALMKLIKIL